MYLLLTSRGDCRLKLLDVESGKFTCLTNLSNCIPDPLHRPFGITWSGSDVFVAYQKGIVRCDRLLRRPEPYLAGLTNGIHQVLHRPDGLWMVSPNLNGVEVYDGKMRYLLPFDGGWVSDKPDWIAALEDASNDVNHFNSVLVRDEKIYLSAHNHKNPSFILVLDMDGKVVGRHDNMGVHAHGLLVWRKQVFTLDSFGSRSLISTGGIRVPIGGEGDYLRGMAATESHIFIGWFKCNPNDRHERETVDVNIVMVNRITHAIDHIFRLPGIGDVNDIRLLDVYDECHGVDPLMTTEEVKKMFYGGVML